MLSVVIPTLNAAGDLPRTLESLVHGSVSSVVREVLLSDAGSTDATAAIADETGAILVTGPRGRGTQLAAGAGGARSDWLLFLHADTVLQPGWTKDVEAFVARPGAPERAAVFRFALDDDGFAPRLAEAIVRFRCAVLALPYGDQGLLIHRHLYDRLGGFRPLPLMEDVDMVRRIGRRRLTFLKTIALTSADRYRKEGYLVRPVRNFVCISFYYLGVPLATIARLYG